MKLQRKTALGLLVLAGLAVGCADEATTKSTNFEIRLSNPGTQAKVAGVLASEINPTFQDANGVTFTITEARLHVRDITFDPSSDGSSGEKHIITGPMVFNLLTGGLSSSTALSSEVPAGTYRRIDVRATAADSAEGLIADTDALDGMSIVITGTHDANTVDTADDGTFSIIYKFTEDLRFDPSTPFTIDDTVGADVIGVMDISQWLVDNTGVSPVTMDLTSCLGALDSLAITYNDGGADTDCTVDPGAINIENTIKNNMKNANDASD